MPIVYRYIHAETGEEIVAFYRKGIIYVYVRDPVTKRFIRGVKWLTIAVTRVFDYPPRDAKKRNPLYVDIKLATTIMAEDLTKIDDIEDEMKKEAEAKLRDFFSEQIAALSTPEVREEYDGIPPRDKMPTPTCVAGEVGVEYVDVPIDETYPEYRYWLVWHHYAADCREETGRGILG